MTLAHTRRAALWLSMLLGACKPEEEPITCSNGQEARNFCCTDPSGEKSEPTCQMSCFQVCESDEDCDELETCQSGVCAEPPEDCSL